MNSSDDKTTTKCMKIRESLDGFVQIDPDKSHPKNVNYNSTITNLQTHQLTACKILYAEIC